MSWSRLTDHDVYTYPHVDGRLVCCACLRFRPSPSPRIPAKETTT
jgi:hypothetical protein